MKMEDSENCKQVLVDDNFDVVMIDLLGCKYKDDVYLDILVKETNQIVRVFANGTIVVEKYEE